MGACCAQGDSRSKELDRKQKTDARTDNKVKKLLLLGAGGSGKSTFFKQLRILHGQGINQKEMENVYKAIVHSNVVQGMKSLMSDGYQSFADNGVAEFKDTGVDGDDKYQEHRRYILKLEEEDFTEQRQSIVAAIEYLWAHPATSMIWDQRAKFQIQDSAAHFFKSIQRICQFDYLPSDDDVLLARIRTTGIVEQEFTIKNNRFQVFDVGGQRNERKKWIHCFEKVTGVIFLASLSAYDQTLYEDDQTNRMKEALDLFKQICNSRWFKDTAMILFLNKKDLFQEKIKKIPLTTCFPDFSEQYAHDEVEARSFIKEQFVKLNHPVKGPNGKSKKKPLFCHYTCAIDRNQVEKIFRDVQNVIIHANLEKAALI